jgi:hypothetical protein
MPDTDSGTDLRVQAIHDSIAEASARLLEGTVRMAAATEDWRREEARRAAPVAATSKRRGFGAVVKTLMQKLTLRSGKAGKD